MTRLRESGLSPSAQKPFELEQMDDARGSFVRPSLRRNGLVPFDPWNAQPLLFLPHRATLIGECLQRARLARYGIGDGGAGRDLAWAARQYRGIMRERARACRAYGGRRALARELLDPGFYLAPRRIYGDVPDPGAFVAT